MTDAGITRTEEFVFRRLGDAFPLSAPDTSPPMLWGVCLGLLVLGVMSVVFPLLRVGGKSFGGGGFVPAMFGAIFGLLFGKVDDGRPTVWHYLAVAARAALFLVPLLFILVARNFEADAEALWYAFTGAVLLIAWTLTVLMYAREAKTIGWWAAPMALLRMAVLAVLAVCFLLPAFQTWEDTEKRSKVVILLDVSPSVTVWSDDISRGEGVKVKTRMDKVLEFLTDDQVAFVANLLKKNPVSVYRFGARLDDEPAGITADARWAKDDWEAFVRYDFKPYVLNWRGADGKGLSDDGKAKVKGANAWGTDPGTSDWAIGWIKAADAESGFEAMTPEDQEVLKTIRAKLDKRIDVARAIAQGTAVPDATTAAVNREAANMTQGLIVFSDGRSNIGSDAAFAELAKRAKEANIPVFTIGVGEAREIVALTVSDLQVPDRTQPDEPTQITVAADGVGFKEAETVDVVLELFLPGKDPKKDAADHEMTQPLKFAAGDPPHGETTFVLDAEELAAKGVTQLVEEAPPGKIGRKFVLKQGAEKGAWQVRAKIARDRREVFREEFHLSPVRPMQVIDKPIRVLIVSSGPSREYQTLRSLMVRETDQKRAEVCIYLQNEGGQTGEIVQDVEPGRLLTKFPDELDTTRKAAAGAEAADAVSMSRLRYNNLDEFDVVVVFDPDWNEKDKAGNLRIPDGAMRKLKTFVDNLGGGLVYVAGPFHTDKLIRTDEEEGRLKPILDILPVVPDDAVFLKSKGIPRTYRRLKFNPMADADLLRLDDEIPLPEADKATAGWERFFTGRDKFTPSAVPGEDLNPKRGFLTHYPVRMVKPGIKPLAEFIEVDDKGQASPKPFYVASQVGAGRTAWIGSPEIYRVRQTDINYYDRFWLKLLRYAAAKRNSGAKSRGQVLMGKEFTSGGPIRVQARVLQPSGEAYTETDLDKPKFTVKQFDQNGNLVKEHGPFDVLKPTKLGAKFEGYYKGQITADPKLFPVDGYRYRVAVSKADLPEPLEGEFVLRTSNPELDNTKPDFAALNAIATPLKDVTDRIADADLRAKLVAGLTAKDAEPGKSRLSFKLAEKDKLQLVPDAILARSQTLKNRGAVDDLWDDELNPAENRYTKPAVDWLRTVLMPPYLRLWVPAVVVCLALVAVVWILRSRAGSPALGTVFTVVLLAVITLTAAVAYLGNPFPVGYAVGLCAALLALEWMTRKLVRLA
jgi:hypothetical protein